MKNSEIRNSAKEKGVKLWEIADALSIADTTLSKKLRRELSAEEKEMILGVIEQLAGKKVS